MDILNRLKNHFINSDSSEIDENYDDLDKKYEQIYEDVKNNNPNINYNLKLFDEVKKTNLFDEEYYIQNYVPFISKKYALLHYLNEGFKFGFNPNKYFDNNKYLERFYDIKKMGLNPLVHYILCQDKNILEKEDLFLEFKYQNMLNDINNNNISQYNKNLRFYARIKDNELFDKNFYILNHNLHLSEDYAILHFLNEGCDLGFNPSKDFDCNEYLKNYPDVKNAGLNPFVHYVLHGQKEGRLFPFSEGIQLKNQIHDLNNEIQKNRIIQNVSLLRDKVSNNNIINVVFIMPAMMFAYERLYNLFNNDPLFKVSIILVPHRIGNKEISEVAKEKYYQVFSLLKERNFDVIEGYDFEINEGIDLESVCNPHIIFYVLPYMRIYPENMRVENIPSNFLYVYIPYGLLLAQVMLFQ